MSVPRRRIAGGKRLERSLVHHVERFQLGHRLAPVPLLDHAAPTCVADALGAGGNLRFAKLLSWLSR